MEKNVKYSDDVFFHFFHFFFQQQRKKRRLTGWSGASSAPKPRMRPLSTSWIDAGIGIGIGIGIDVDVDDGSGTTLLDVLLLLLLFESVVVPGFFGTAADGVDDEDADVFLVFPFFQCLSDFFVSLDVSRRRFYSSSFGA